MATISLNDDGIAVLGWLVAELAAQHGSPISVDYLLPLAQRRLQADLRNDSSEEAPIRLFTRRHALHGLSKLPAGLVELRGDTVSGRRHQVGEIHAGYVDALGTLSLSAIADDPPTRTIRDDDSEFLDSSFLLYQKEIQQYQLLSAADERRLGFSIELGLVAEGLPVTTVSALFEALTAQRTILERVLATMGWPRRLALSTATSNPALLLLLGGPVPDDIVSVMNREFLWSRDQTVGVYEELSHTLGLIPPRVDGLISDDPRLDALAGATEELRGSRPAAELLAHHLDWLRDEGRKARQTLVLHNLRLAASLARRRMHQGLPLLDLIQEGNIGLMKAAERFEHRRGLRFSTYATWWVRQSISRGVMDQGRLIRIPVHMGEKLYRVLPIVDELRNEEGAAPSSDEIAAEYERRYGERLPSESMEAALSTLDLESLDDLLTEDLDGDGYADLHDLLHDLAAQDPTLAAQHQLLTEQVGSVFDSLTGRERRVLELRFGMDGHGPRTLEEVGREYSLTRERIRQIEAAALRKLRHPSRSRSLRDYYEISDEHEGESRSVRESPAPRPVWPREDEVILDIATTPPELLRRGDWVSIRGRTARVSGRSKELVIATSTGWSLRRERDGSVLMCRCEIPDLRDNHVYALLGVGAAGLTNVPDVGNICNACMRPVPPGDNRPPDLEDHALG